MNEPLEKREVFSRALDDTQRVRNEMVLALDAFDERQPSSGLRQISRLCDDMSRALDDVFTNSTAGRWPVLTEQETLICCAAAKLWWMCNEVSKDLADGLGVAVNSRDVFRFVEFRIGAAHSEFLILSRGLS